MVSFMERELLMRSYPMKTASLLVVAAGLCLLGGLTWDNADVTALSSGAQSGLWGGVQWCVSGCTGSNCECQTHDCSDIECCECWTYEGGKWVKRWCKGDNGDPDDVTACYKKTAPSASCTLGDYYNTNCTGDAWDDQGCFGTADHEDIGLNGNNCT